MAVQYRETALENSLRVVGEVVPEAHSAAIGFFVKTGARDEDASVMGVSHFLEHMMFKGTDTRTAEDVDRAFDDLGVSHNAFTTAEMTAFYAHGLPEALMDSAAILADILRPSLREADFDDEKSVILEEIAMYDDNPFWRLYERTLDAYYGDHPLSHRVLGTADTINAMSADQMRAYFTQRYSADNTVVAMAGNLDFEAMTDRLRSHCGGWNTSDATRDHGVITPGGESFTMALPTINRHYILGVAPAPALQDERRYASAILSQILGDVEGSRLYWALIETGLAEEAVSQYDGRDGVGDSMVYASCRPEDAETVKSVIHEQIEGLADSLTEDDLLRVKSKVATAATLHGEMPGGRMRRLGQVWTYQGAYRSLEYEVERIDSVTLDDLREIAEAYPLHPRIIGELTPEDA